MASSAAQTESSPRNAPSPAWFRFLAPSITDLIFIILLVAMTSGSLSMRLLGDAGIGWHIRNGEQMLRTHAVTRTDPFSVTMGGHTWYAWEWLYDVAIAGVHHRFGLNGVVFLTAIIIALTFALTLRLALRRGADLPIAVWMLALSLGASMIHLFARPHVLSWLFTVVWFQLLDNSNGDEDRRRLWWLPPLMLLWVNLHGGFVMGFALLGLYLLSDAILYFRCRQPAESHRLASRMRTLGTVTALSLLASLLNPYGYELHIHVYRYLSSRWLMNHIDEFLSPNFHGIAQQCFVAVMLMTIGALAMARTRLPLSRLFVVLLATYSGLYASRSLPVSCLLLTLVMAPVWTQALAEATGNPNLSSRLRSLLALWRSFTGRVGSVELGFRGHAWPVVTVFVVLLVCAQQGRIGSRQWMDAHFDHRHLPVHATDVIIERGVRDPVFAPDSWGGYLIYRLYPRNRVFLDDRHDFYGEEYLKDYLRAIRLAPDWNKFLDEKRVNWVLLPAGSALENMLELTAHWSLVYRDRTAVLLERNDKK